MYYMKMISEICSLQKINPQLALFDCNSQKENADVAFPVWTGCFDDITGRLAYLAIASYPGFN